MLVVFRIHWIHFSNLAKSLHEISRCHKIRKEGEKTVRAQSEIAWVKCQQQSFEGLKQAMCEDVLRHDFYNDFSIIVKNYYRANKFSLCR
jgi:hypothetical protein